MFGLFRKKGKHTKNDAVRKALAAHGDDGTRVRHVIHFAYPNEGATAISQDAARDLLRQIADVAFTETQESTGVVFEHHREVASADFDGLTDRFEQALSDQGWKYDGWECAVETGEQ